jgi:hypothetical protein
MGTKRKVRYTSHYQESGSAYPTLILTGRSFLLHEEETEKEELQRGDVLFYLFGDTAGRDRDNPLYDQLGGAGYLKAMVYDGKDWQFLLMDEIFAHREHHYSKKELPLDTYAVCKEVIANHAGLELERRYRQHYEPLRVSSIKSQSD